MTGAGTAAPVDISVVIPTHARDHLLTEAIATVVAQTLRPREVIVCDDTASAATRALVADWGTRTGGLVRYVDSSGTGRRTAGASRNVGAGQVTGELLAFLDDDDLWEPQHLERLAGTLAERGVDVAVSWTRADDPTFVFARMTEGLALRDVVSRNPGFVGSNFLVRTAVLRALGGFDPDLRVSNDQDLLVRLLQGGYTYAVVPEFTVRNRIHAGDQLTDKTETRARAVRAYYAKHASLMGWRDRVVIGTIVAGIRRVTAPGLPARVAYTGLTAAGKGIQLVTRPASR